MQSQQILTAFTMIYAKPILYSQKVKKKKKKQGSVKHTIGFCTKCLINHEALCEELIFLLFHSWIQGTY